MAQRMMPWITPLSLSTMSVLNISNGKVTRELDDVHFPTIMIYIHPFPVINILVNGFVIPAVKKGTPTPLRKYSVLTTPNNI